MTDPNAQVFAQLAAMKATIAQLTTDLVAVERAVLGAIAAPPAPAAPAPTTTPPTSQLASSGTGLVHQRMVMPGPPDPHDKRSSKPVSPKQNWLIDKLLGEKFARIGGQVINGLDATQVIGRLLDLNDVPEDQRDYSTAIDPAPVPEKKSAGVTDKIDLNVLKLIPDGRYAVNSDDNTQTIFIRMTTKKNGRDDGARIVQQRLGSGVGNKWKELQKYYPSGQVYGVNEVYGTSIADLLTQIMMDKAACADRYGARWQECSNCGAELSDDKSRYYRLGSECIKHRQDIVDYVDNTAGPWFQGAASRD